MHGLNREWIKYLDTSEETGVEIFPIQFANCDRLQNNDAVYIFDEVGSGKTISSGLMALDFLMNNKESKILTITTNALIKKNNDNDYGQFLNDWFNKLPFEILDLKSKIDIVNNHYSSFNNQKEYGLVIIDEAHLLLNKQSLRYQKMIENIRANKIVFLTATPIKESEIDLEVYVDIARSILNRNDISTDWIEDICTIDKSNDELICNTFDIKFPATRYFKDTIKSVNIRNIENTAKRLLPQVWEYDTKENKNQKMLKMINKQYELDYNNKFIIFTRYVEKEAIIIANFLKENGFQEYREELIGKKTYKIVTGDNGHELANLSGFEGIPTVLILTYQIAEQGVNLPGFNHVINYHIPSFPSALEQRFGRIDRSGRGGDKFKEIHMCYLISKNVLDNNTANFYEAISAYLQTLLSYLPSKNTILSAKIMDIYNQDKFLMSEYIEKLLLLCENEKELDNVISYYEKYDIIINSDQEDTSIKLKEVQGFGLDGENELLKFCEDKGIIINFKDNINNIREELRKEIKGELNVVKQQISIGSSVQINTYKEMLKHIQDKVFYCKKELWNFKDYKLLYKENNIGCLDPIGESSKYIQENPKYKEYLKYFNENIKVTLIFKKYRDKANEFFENKFIENMLEDIFPLEGYRNLFQAKIIKKHLICEDDEKIILLDNIDSFVRTLPFFKMCYRFKKILCGVSMGTRNTLITKFDFNPFEYSLFMLGKEMLGITENFYCIYWKRKREDFSKLFTIYENEEVTQASNWYKLAYELIKSTDIRYEWIECLKIYDSELHNIEHNIESNRRKCSLFYHYIFTTSNEYRKYICEDDNAVGMIYEYDRNKIKSSDIWSKGIYSEIFK